MRIDNPCKAFFYCDNDVVFHILSWLAVKTLDLRLFLAPLSILHCARVRIASERRTAATKALGRYRTATACDPIERVHPSVSLPKRWLRLLLREIHKRDRSAENPERRFPTVFYVLSVFSSRSGEGFVLSDVPLCTTGRETGFPVAVMRNRYPETTGKVADAESLLCDLRRSERKSRKDGAMPVGVRIVNTYRAQLRDDLFFHAIYPSRPLPAEKGSDERKIRQGRRSCSFCRASTTGIRTAAPVVVFRGRSANTARPVSCRHSRAELDLRGNRLPGRESGWLRRTERRQRYGDLRACGASAARIW